MQKVLNTSGRQFSFFFQDKNLVTVCPDCKEEDVRKIISTFDTIFNSGGEGATLTCGISPSKQGYAAVSDGYRKAVMALKVATLHGESCVGYSDMGIYKLLVHIKIHRYCTRYMTKRWVRLKNSTAQTVRIIWKRSSAILKMTAVCRRSQG